MVSSASDIPNHATSKVIINAQLYAGPGEADKVQEHLTAIQRFSLSDQEPGCLEYRTVRSFVTEGPVKFAVFEKYTGPDAVNKHFTSKPFQDLVAAIESGLLTGPPQIEYFYEFSA